ncbi:MAG: hypothetical protein Q8K40_09270, partial [Ignavibacteria bacterium]|nr:hypothetical protein [Ignavibacteria bacterium]
MAKKIKPEDPKGYSEEKKPVRNAYGIAVAGGEEVPVSGIFDQDGELVIDVYETNSDFVVLTAIAGI